jgi:amidase
MTDPLNAFTEDAIDIPGAAGGPLAGLSFAAKDLFDVAGFVTGGGNPDWRRTHGPATRHAAVIAALLEAGAHLKGRTITDEISLGILGENMHYGTPVNPRAPGRVPGGSSSGSASAVAGGVVDLALGTDTGGSVRVPASFCGLFGLRPSHGRVPVAGMLPQAASFDTAGFFARSAALMGRAGAVLLGPDAAVTKPRTLLVASNAFAAADAGVIEALRPKLASLAELFESKRDITLAAEGLEHWKQQQRLLQSSEAYANFRPWIETHNPRFAFSVARGQMIAAAITAEQRAPALAFQAVVRARLDGLLGTDAVLAIPTTPFPAPPCGLSIPDQMALRERIGLLTCIAGFTGLPQISLPLGRMPDGLPVGLSLIGPRGTDRMLIDLAGRIEAMGLVPEY